VVLVDRVGRRSVVRAPVRFLSSGGGPPLTARLQPDSGWSRAAALSPGSPRTVAPVPPARADHRDHASLLPLFSPSPSASCLPVQRRPAVPDLCALKPGSRGLKRGVGFPERDVYELRLGSWGPWQPPRSWDHHHVWRSHGRVARPGKSEKAERQESQVPRPWEDVTQSICSTILPNCAASSMRRSAAPASASGKTVSTTGRRPLGPKRASMARKSSGEPMVLPSTSSCFQ